MLPNKILHVVLFNFVSIWVAVRSLKWAHCPIFLACRCILQMSNYTRVWFLTQRQRLEYAVMWLPPTNGTIFGPKISGPFTIPRVCSPKRLRPITSQKHMSLSFEFLENIFLEQIQTKFLKDLYNSCTTLQLTQGVLKKLIKHPRFNIFIFMIDQ